MSTTRSKDGTRIAFDRRGTGPALIIVDGAMCHRGMGPSGPLAQLLAPHFTVITYDRRGRGESGDTAPYDVQREVEDIEALIDEAGGQAYLYGVSSGAALALKAAEQLPGVAKVAVFEAPFIVDRSREPMTAEYWGRIEAAAEGGDPGLAVKLFMKAVGVPGIIIRVMSILPSWAKLKAVARTLPHDGALVAEHQQGRPLPADAWRGVTMPALVLDGGKSPAWMRNAMRSLAGILPNAKYQTLPGQTHMVKASAQLQPLVAFFGA
jgi:pimeloyl-ACP methyl ester carboxylesterase